MPKAAAKTAWSLLPPPALRVYLSVGLLRQVALNALLEPALPLHAESAG
jgi:hypothetical protein